MFRAFGHHVAMCCNMLGVIGSSLELVKFEPTTPNMTQQVAKRGPNAGNMLRYVALACCGALGLKIHIIEASNNYLLKCLQYARAHSVTVK